MHTLIDAPEWEKLRNRAKREMARGNLTIEQAAKILYGIDDLVELVDSMYMTEGDEDGREEE